MSIYYTKSNTETAKELFEKRTIYNADARKSAPGYKNLVDFNFAEKFLYGRVNRYFVPIIRSSASFKLKPFAAQSGNQEALIFVVEAFRDLAMEFQRCAATGQIDANDPFLSNLIVYKAYESPTKLYDGHMNNYINAIVGQFRSNDIKVKNFDEFIEEFERQVSVIIPQYPITQPAYIKSRLCPITISGLAVEIATMDYANDEEKINQFVNSRNWEFYVNACRSYGFMVDKFVPWRIVADIGSAEMIGYAAQHCTGLNSTDALLNLAYTPAHDTFFKNFKFILYNLYNKVKLKSFLELTNCNGEVKTQKVVPQNYSLEEFSTIYSEAYFLKLYFRLRLIEEESPFKDFESEMLIDDSMELYEASGLTKALEAFERVVNKTFDYRGSLSYTKEYLEAIAAETT